MGTLANSEDSDEMQQNVAFHQSRHCLLKIKTTFNIDLEITNLWPLNELSQAHLLYQQIQQTEEFISIRIKSCLWIQSSAYNTFYFISFKHVFIIIINHFYFYSFNKFKILTRHATDWLHDTVTL